jgi:uncharacterized OsmC-like protein
MDWNHLADPIGNEIRLRGELGEAQRKGFLETSARCPVHGTLASEIKLQTNEAKGALIA